MVDRHCHDDVIAAERVEPAEDRCRDIGILGDEVARTDEPMDFGTRKPGLEVVEVDVREHRVRWAPEQQSGHILKFVQTRSHTAEGCVAGMIGAEWYVLDEVRDR
jgi:hypothetical protein